MSPVLITFSGDSAPARDFYFQRLDGTIPDLTGSTVQFKIYDPETGQETNSASNTCAITDAAGGVATYTFNIGTDIPNPGIYQANLVITYPDNRVETALVKIAAETPVP